MSDDLESIDLHQETVRALMVGVRNAADRMKERLPAHVDVNDVVSAGYLALTQALAYWQEGSEEPFEVHAMKRASAAMVAMARATNPPPSRNGQRFVNQMKEVQESLGDALGPDLDSLDTLVSPPCHSEVRGDPDIAMEEIGVHVA